MKLLYIFFFIFHLFLFDCHGQDKIRNNEGLVFCQIRHFDPVTYSYVLPSPYIPDIKVWYKDNMVIEEIHSVFFKTDTNNKKTISGKKLEYYLFIDRKTHSFYHYSSFSDTARVLKSYVQADSSELRDMGGWPFYATNYIKYDVITPIPDTIVYGVTYKRIKFIHDFGKYSLPTIGYLRCDKKEGLFHLDKKITEEMGCPMVRMDHQPTIANPRPMSIEIVYSRDRLSRKERTVFDAWKNNLLKFPVLK